MARYKQVTFRVDEFERAAIQKAAHDNQRREGDFIRLIVLEAIGYKPPVDHPDYTAPRRPSKPKPREEQQEQAEDDRPSEASDFSFDEEGYVEVKPFRAPEPEPFCVQCDHPRGAHVSSPQLGDRCMICPPTEESLHKAVIAA